MVVVNSSANGNISIDDKPVEQLDQVLKRLIIGGKTISAYDYVVRCETAFFSIF